MIEVQEFVEREDEVRMMFCRHRLRVAGAFTLVEMLTAVTIVTVLVSLAAPSVAKATRMARNANCQARLAVLAKACMAYAGESRGYLPAGPIEAGYWPADPDRGSPFELYDSRRINSDMSSCNGWYGFGRLWKGRYVDDGRTFYCAEAERTGALTYSQAWPSATDGQGDPADGKTRIFSSYAYRGGLTSHMGQPEGPLSIGADGSLPILADNPCFSSFWHRNGYNIAFADGHIKFAGFDSPVVPAGHLQDLWEMVKP